MFDRAIGLCGSSTDMVTKASTATLSTTVFTDGIFSTILQLLLFLLILIFETCHLPLVGQLDWILFTEQYHFSYGTAPLGVIILVKRMTN